MDIGELFAGVIVDVAARNVDKTFHYRVPASLAERLKIGSRVVAPFGNRKVSGFVVELIGKTEMPGVKDIIELVEADSIDEELVKLSLWIAETYLCPKSVVLKGVSMPVLKSTKRRIRRFYLPNLTKQQAMDLLQAGKRYHKQISVLQASLAQPGLTRQQLARKAGVSVSTVDAALKRGLVKTTEVIVPYKRERARVKRGYALTGEQQAAVKALVEALSGNNKNEYYLLHGVTGSGKTAVYLAAARKAVQFGKQVIVLVPEISLTTQLLDEFFAVFGERVAVLHSALSAGERASEWKRIQEGDADVVIGARSAIFAPVPNLGLVILDEEHEQTYKQEESPRYHARDVAIQRAELTGSVLIMGSATPALETYCRALKGGFKHLSLQHRVERKPLPEVRIVDMRQELYRGNKGLFSQGLIEGIGNRLDLGEQTVLFLNRRGFSTFIICRECGEVLKCPHCEISLTYHQDGDLHCHYCNYTSRAPSVCPLCGSKYINYLGAGTQRIEREISRIFPEARVSRMDSDTTTRKGSHEKIINSAARREIDILVGTQMVAKGLNLPGVTLVGVVNADSTLYMPDFRAAERTFQLLTQVAGRAGRGSNPGEVLIQTYSPEHYSIRAAQKHDYLEFLREELKIRSSLSYPPFTLLARLMLYGSDGDFVEGKAKALKEYLKDVCRSYRENELVLLGPSPAAVYKTKDQYRWQIIVKGTSRLAVRDLCSRAIERFNGGKRCRLIVDIDPQGI